MSGENAHRRIRQQIDDACDQVESDLQQGDALQLNSVFARVERPFWPELSCEIVAVVRELRPSWKEADLLAQAALDAPELAVKRELLAAPFHDSTLVDDTTHSSDDLGLLEILAQTPSQIGRFEVKELIGCGGHGRVYRAFDPQLARDVVIKLRRPDQGSTLGAGHGLVAEAKKAAFLEHPGIVSIHEVGEYKGLPFSVQAYISGGTLRTRLPDLSRRESVAILVQVLEAIAFAHEKRILHRDLKPENILLGEDGRPFVADFGLAISELEQIDAEGQFAGTPEYMSPEQVRKESHRLTASSDIWSLGVMLYQMLTGSRPFRKSGGGSKQLVEQILNFDPAPPRQLNSEIPAELERICLKCLAKDSRQRYSQAVDLSRDLARWLNSDAAADCGDSVSSGPVAAHSSLVPKGMVAFDESDSGFFLDLLPGQRRSGGVPEAVGFWNDWVERSDETAGFVGLIYGPSGCGKTSLVRAGVLPLLSDKIASVFVEATADDTAACLLGALRRQFPAIPADLCLPDVFLGLRKGQWNVRGKKILIVLDQFEQWLHSHGVQSDSELVDAIRHCDGSAIQTLVLVRDDFWMAVSRFFQRLEIPLLQNANFRAVDRFDIQHAEFVLTKLGQAYGRLSAGEQNAEAAAFVKTAVKQLAVDSQVICVQLVLFAETIKTQPWTASTLESLGDTSEIGTLYLEQCISSESASPGIRSKEHEIRAVLTALLPVSGAAIKGGRRSKQALADAVELDVSSDGFSCLMDMLVRQLRIISPVELDSHSLTGPSTSPMGTSETAPVSTQQYYQLTHDFLVESTRIWLQRRDRQTPAGRARIRFQQLAEDWNHSRDARALPTWLEFAAIARYVRPGIGSQRQRSFYRAAAKRHFGRLAIALVVAIALVAGVLWNRNRHQADLARIRVAQLLACDSSALPIVVGVLQQDNANSRTEILRRLADLPGEPVQELRMQVAMAILDGPNNQTVNTIVQLAGEMPIAQAEMLLLALRGNRPASLAALQQRIADEESGELKSVLGLLLFHLGDDEPLMDFSDDWDDTHQAAYTSHVMVSFSSQVEDYLGLLTKYGLDPTQHDRLANVLNGISCFDLDKLSDVHRKQLEVLCREFFLTSYSAFMHSASETALMRLKADVPRQLLPIGEPEDDRQWMVDAFGQTFVLVDPSGIRLNIPLSAGGIRMRGQSEQPFWLATRETTNRLFMDFADSPAGKTVFEKPYKPIRGLRPEAKLSEIGKVRLAPTSILSLEAVLDKPVSGRNQRAFLAYCNWLSQSAALDPAYQAREVQGGVRYLAPLLDHQSPMEVAAQERVRKESAKRRHSMEAHENRGYRLPSPFEWGVAVFSGRVEALPYKNGPLVKRYGDLDDGEEGNGLHRDVQSFLPNERGIYDLVGNAEELTFEPSMLWGINWRIVDSNGGIEPTAYGWSKRDGQLGSGIRLARTASKAVGLPASPETKADAASIESVPNVWPTPPHLMMPQAFNRDATRMPSHAKLLPKPRHIDGDN